MSYTAQNLELDEDNQDMYSECFGYQVGTKPKNGTAEEEVLSFHSGYFSEFSIAVTSKKANVTTDAYVYGCNQTILNTTHPLTHNRCFLVGTITVTAQNTGGGYFRGLYKHVVISLINGTSANVTNAIAIDVHARTRG